MTNMVRSRGRGWLAWFTILVSGCCMGGAGPAPTAEPTAAPVVAAPVALPPIPPVSPGEAADAVAASYVLQSGAWGSMYVSSLWGPTVAPNPPVPGATPLAAFAYHAPGDTVGEAIFAYSSPRVPTDAPVALVGTAQVPAAFTADAPDAPGAPFAGFDVGWRLIHQDTITTPHAGRVAAFARGPTVYWLVCYSVSYPNAYGGYATSCDRPLSTFRPPPGM